MSYTPESPDADYEGTPYKFLFVSSLEDVHQAMCPLLSATTHDTTILFEPLGAHIDYARAVTEELLADDYGDIKASVIQNTLAELTQIGRNVFEIFIDKTHVGKTNLGFVEPVPEQPIHVKEPELDKAEAIEHIINQYGLITALNVRNVLEAAATNR